MLQTFERNVPFKLCTSLVSYDVRYVSDTICVKLTDRSVDNTCKSACSSGHSVGYHGGMVI